MEGYVVVATFSTHMEAELAQATLAAAEIESFLQLDDTGGMLPSLQESGGVKLLVDPSRLDEARMILSEQATSQE